MAQTHDKETTLVPADGHAAGIPGSTGADRLRPRENGQRVSSGEWEGMD